MVLFWCYFGVILVLIERVLVGVILGLYISLDI